MQPKTEPVAGRLISRGVKKISQSGRMEVIEQDFHSGGAFYDLYIFAGHK